MGSGSFRVLPIINIYYWFSLKSLLSTSLQELGFERESIDILELEIHKFWISYNNKAKLMFENLKRP